jgi:hypothetical protein
MLIPWPLWSLAHGVAHGARRYATSSLRLPVLFLLLPFGSPRLSCSSTASGVVLVIPVASKACGVGHEVEPLPDVRSTEARSAGIDRPDGVVLTFQVIRNIVEPSEAVRGSNLLAKDDVRAALADEPEELGPQMAFVALAAALPCRAEWLAWAGAGPDFAVVRPSGVSERVGPYADSCEKVALPIPGNIGCCNVTDAPFVDIAGRDVSRFDEVA